jgi:phage terminase small subunit
MARPRTPAAVLELRGSYKKDPQRRRKDPDGAGVFDADPPTHLPQGAVAAWHYVVARLPKVAITSSDEIAVEMAARNLAALWALGDLAPFSKEFKSYNENLRHWLGRLGMTPADRAKIPALPDKPASNPFSSL